MVEENSNDHYDYSRFLNIYANLPERLRKEIIAVIDEAPYTWNTAYTEIRGETELGKRIYKRLIETEII